MKFASFSRNGSCGFGVVSGEGIVDATDRLAPGVNSLKKAILNGVLENASQYAEVGAPRVGMVGFSVSTCGTRSGKNILHWS